MDYKTIAAPARTEYVEKRSRFLASAARVETEEQAQEFIARVKSEFHDARHNVFAYITGGAERFSDDGEPQGTAGIPVLEVLRRRGVVRTAVVVTRYFGGILLGAPGLVRAYGHAASLALDASGVLLMRHCDIVRFSCGYDLYAQADALARTFGTVDSRDFGAQVTLQLFIPKGKTAEFAGALTELSCGTVDAVADGETFVAESAAV